MTTAAVDGPTSGTVPEGVAAAALDLARSGPVVVLTDDDAAGLTTAEIHRLGGGTRLEGLRTTTSPVLRRAVLDRLALGQVDVVVVAASAWDPALAPAVTVVDARSAPVPVSSSRYVLCRLGAR